MDETTKRQAGANSDSAGSQQRLPAQVAPPADLCSPLNPSGSERAAATQVTYATKLPVDHPGLQLDTPKPRTIRRGPILATVAILGVTVAIALLVALSPRGDRAKAATTPITDSPTRGIELPDSVQNAPGNNADLHHQTPQLGPPLHGADRPNEASWRGGGPGGVGQRAALRIAAQEEQSKAFASPILADVDNPVQGEQVGRLSSPGAVLAPAAAAASPLAGLLSNMASSGSDPNLQQHKTDFLNRDGVNSSNYLGQSLIVPRSPYELKAGAIIPTTLITGINSDLPGQIVGQVRENVYDTVSGNYLLIPQGSRLIATYDSSVTFGQERVLVCWNRLIRPDGISISLECMPGVDLAGHAGFSDQVDHHWWRIITGVALGTLLSATAQRSAGDVSGYNPTVPQLWAANAGASVNQASQQITQKNLAIQPTVKVRPGYTVNVLVTKDIVLLPYNRAAP